MIEKDRNDLANDLYWIHDLVGSATVSEDGLEVSQSAFEKAQQHDILEECNGNYTLKYFKVSVDIKKG